MNLDYGSSGKLVSEKSKSNGRSVLMLSIVVTFITITIVPLMFFWKPQASGSVRGAPLKSRPARHDSHAAAMDWLSSLPHGRPHVHVNASEESLFLGVLLKDDPTDHSCIQLHVGETLLSIN